MASFTDILKNLKGILNPESPRNIKKRTEGAISKMQRTKGAPRRGGGSPATDYSGVNVPLLKSSRKQKRIAPGNINKGAKLYKASEVGKDYPKYKTNTKHGSVQQITEDTKYGGMQTNKQGKLKSPATVTVPKVDKPKSKKRFRAGPTMTGMGGMRKSGTLRGKYVK